ncbi:glycosyltransferase family 2 protein [Acinetobacter indicus]|uniref:glycosyltransferase family 2 protein n=1 Tax=Acinetobacter indicus TaxID=756892 RepID=UPI001443D0FA|nr:glycosyltransferase family 2 protein [Acinetobacter indicus]
MKTYSIIIPHYNEVKRLERLLSSIPLERSNLQVIVVDDCSPDQMGLAQVQQLFPTVNFFSTPSNQGAGAARNIGLKHAIGEFILFADADDEFLDSAFKHFDKAIAHDADIYYFLADAVIENTGEHSVRADVFNRLIDQYLDEPNEENTLNLKLAHCVPWAKIYKNSFIQKTQVLFDETPVSNDIYFNIINAVHAQRIHVVDKTVYRVYRLTDSLTSTQTAERLLCRLKVSGKVATELNRLGVQHSRSASGFLAQSLAFGPSVFIQALMISVRSDLHLNLLRVVNVSRWLRYFKRSNTTRVETNK